MTMAALRIDGPEPFDEVGEDYQRKQGDHVGDGNAQVAGNNEGAEQEKESASFDALS